MRLALGKVGSCSSEESSIRDFKRSVMADLDAAGWKIQRHLRDRIDVPTDFWYQDFS